MPSHTEPCQKNANKTNPTVPKHAKPRQTLSVMPNHYHVIEKKAKLSYYGLPFSAP
jgi:hypothetical protein